MQCLDIWIMVSDCQERASMGKPTDFPWRKEREWKIVFWNEKWKWFQLKQLRADLKIQLQKTWWKIPVHRRVKNQVVFRLHHTLIFLHKYCGEMSMGFFLCRLVQPKRIVCGRTQRQQRFSYSGVKSRAPNTPTSFPQQPCCSQKTV